MGTGTLDITDARKDLNKVDERLRDEHVIYVTRHNKQVFAMVDLAYLEAVLETIEIMTDPDSHRMFMESLEDIKQGRVHDHDDVREELGL